jgi:predicted RNase H-like HicB family nuclease
MYDAIVLHVKGLIEDDAPVPVSQAFSEYLVIGDHVTA